MLWSRKSKRPPTHSTRTPTRLRLERLEAREVLYSVAGNAWPNPELVTISFVPDGTVVGSDLNGPITSNLFATLNARFGSAATWQNEILRAAQLWAQQTNVNFKVVSDDGVAIGSGNYQQGDPNHGDIRIGGYFMGTGSSDPLACTYQPPPVNNYDIAGDMTFNTQRTWFINNPTQAFDLFTVATHEFGHALGLNHSNGTPGATATGSMWASYTSRKTALATDDVNAIRAVNGWTSGFFSSPGYQGARKSDTYDLAASNGSFTSASLVTSTIDAVSMTAMLTNQEITSTSDVDFFKFVVPAGMGGSLTVAVQSAGLSQLAPTLTVYDNGQTQLATASGAGQYGTTLTATLSVTEGHTYYVRVAAAVTTAFGTGKYALTLALNGTASPTVPLPITTTINAPVGGGGGGTANRVPDPTNMLLPSFTVSSPTGCGCGACAAGVAALQSRGPEMQLQHLNVESFTSPVLRTSRQDVSRADHLAQLMPVLLAAGNFGQVSEAIFTSSSPADDWLERADESALLAWATETKPSDEVGEQDWVERASEGTGDTNFLFACAASMEWFASST